ncbi:MAG: phosphatidylglycerophosphatase A [Candidatus Omnitrophica bacterium]|nr:phosphatidylglycerophosphatase A [Candidatus Omnitrophota bacterium]
MKFKEISDFLVKTASTVFFIGYLPLVPGTFGSIAGVGLFYLLKGAAVFTYLSVILAVIVLGLVVCGRTEKLLNKKDPGCIVIDEVAGMLLALSFLPYDFKIVFLAFLIFRILDTLKPYPASRLQNRHGAVGVMGDDLVAGIYTNIVLQIILKLPLQKLV